MTKHQLIFLAGSIILGSFISSPSNAQQSEAVTYKVFYDALSPFGKWINDPVNKYVWVPNVEKGFRPYFTNGSWKMTSYGSTWISNYSWGWAPFHYGRWIFDSLYGWVWIPGLDWGPAWVVWRTNGDDYGWTPLTPGFNISQSFSPNYYVPADWWVYVPKKWLLNNAFQTHASYNAKNNADMLNHTHVINNIYTANNTNYISGPRAEEFSRAINSPVTVYSIKYDAKPGKTLVGSDQVTLYAPAMKKWESGQEPKPANSVASEHTLGKLSALSSRSTGSVTAAKPQVKKKIKPKNTAIKKPKTN